MEKEMNTSLSTLNDLYLDKDIYAQSMLVAKTLAKSSLIPEHFQGHAEDVFVVCQLAFRTGVDPMGALQKSYVIKGKPGVESQLAIAMFHASTGLRIRYRWANPTLPPTEKMACVAYVNMPDGTTIEHTLMWKTVISSGWASRDPWKRDPKMMLMYRAAMQMIRANFPEAILGVYTVDEVNEEFGTNVPAPK